MRLKTQKKSTIRDVAKQAGVSTWTVSKVLSSDVAENGIPESTRMRVIEATRQLDYVPNINAQRFFRCRSNVIGILVPPLEERNNAFTDPHFAAIMLGLESKLHKTPYNLMFFFNHEEFKQENRYADVFRAGMIDGLLIWGIHQSDHYWNHLKELVQPVIFLATIPALLPGEAVNYIASDYQEGARKMIKEQLETGKQRILWLAGPSDSSIYSSLHHCILDEMGKHGLQTSALAIYYSSYDYEDGIALTGKAYQKHVYDLILTTSSPLAEGALDVLAQKRNGSVPVISFDSHVPPAEYGKKYSALVADDREIGRLALASIIGLIEDHHNEKKIQIRIPPKICRGI